MLYSSLFYAPVGKTMQFGPYLNQNYKTLPILILCKDFFNFKFLV